MKNKNSANCDMCGMSSDQVPLVINPKYFIIGRKVIELAHEGKYICCDCLHDELIILGGEENE